MAIPEHLVAAYRRTTFQADTPIGRLSIRWGKGDERLDALLAQHGAQTWAYVTACNPQSKSLADPENTARQKALIGRLAGRFPVYHGQGVGDEAGWKPEPSVLVIGMSSDEAGEIGREFGQYAVVVGRRNGAAELHDCASPFSEPAKSPPDDKYLCLCPVCRAAYRSVEHRCCEHIVTDWCFTFDCEPGSPRGFWASDGEGRVLIAFESELARLSNALDEYDWPEQRRRKFLNGAPAHLGFIRNGHGAIGYDDLLHERLCAAVGYIGCARVNTGHFASDEWLVYWARDGAAVARAVEASFQSDLAWLKQALGKAVSILGIDETDFRTD